MSRPIVVTAGMSSSSEPWGLNSAHIRGTHVPGGGAVHSIKIGFVHCSKTHRYWITHKE
jgi:hypothetical protein